MNRTICLTMVAAILVSGTAFAAKDSTMKYQNSVRVGYDDNIYQSRESNRQETAFITDIFTLTGDLKFSERSELELFWQPEIRYRFDADPNAVMYQDLYGRFVHGISERMLLEVSDRFRYQEKDGQTDTIGEEYDQNFLENDLMGALDYTLTKVSRLKVGAGYEFRIWNEDSYGEWQPANPPTTLIPSGGNNYNTVKGNLSYLHMLKSETTMGSVGVNYMDLEYDGQRGGYNGTTLYGSVNHNFNPNLLGTAQLGYTFATVDSSVNSEDTSTPFAELGLDYIPSERTKLTGTLGYTLAASQNSFYNASDEFSLGLGLRQDITGKISASASLRYVFAMYDSNYAAFNLPDAEEDFVRFSLRGSYQISRNHFIDAGYEFTTRETDSIALQEYKRNRVDMGWRMRF